MIGSPWPDGCLPLCAGLRVRRGFACPVEAFVVPVRACCHVRLLLVALMATDGGHLFVVPRSRGFHRAKTSSTFMVGARGARSRESLP